MTENDPFQRASVEQFYTGAGSALVRSETVPQRMHSHLAAERVVSAHAVSTGHYTCVVEAGCMDGCLHMETLLQCDIRYFGIDLVESFIATLRQALQEKRIDKSVAYAERLDICDLELLGDTLRGERVLVLFPFNAYGNVDRPTLAAEVIARCGYDVLVLSYQTTQHASAARQAYYAACCREHVVETRTADGVLFQTDAGLHSYAYYARWFSILFERHNWHMRRSHFGSFGAAYWGCEIRRCERVTDSFIKGEAIENHMQPEEPHQRSIEPEMFQSVDMRVGQILEVRAFDRARQPTYQVRVDLGAEIGERWSSARITNYPKEELVGMQVVCVVNLPPKNIAGFMSEVLILGVSNPNGGISLLAPEGPAMIGSRVY